MYCYSQFHFPRFFGVSRFRSKVVSSESNTSDLQGLETNVFAPAAIASRLMSSPTSADSTRIGMDNRRFSRALLVAVIPSTTGIRKSITQAENSRGSILSSSRASSPPPQQVTLK
mmetsp:Transcript_10361/g.14252  ORF Transcript_10361/g.14252 Transcript_10361/m.14252 type:complete len:115 (-) Transcript_10361:380-724(-)